MRQAEIPILPMETTAPLRWQFQAAFHQRQLQRVRQNLGRECLYLSHVKEGDIRFIKAVMLDDEGKKQSVPIKIANPDLNLFREKEYDKVQKYLGTKKYERDTKTI